MTKKTSDTPDTDEFDAPEDTGGKQGLTHIPLQVHAQYLKDLSFENPHAPESLLKLKQAPNVAVEINVNANPIPQMGEKVFEVALTIQVRAGGEAGGEGEGEGKTAFITEVVYAGVFALGDLPEDAIHPMLFIECPRLLFPFARSILGEVTRDGGYPPLMINPIDFTDLYNKNQSVQVPAGHA